MQVVCANCQLSFDAPDGATGLVCPICRGPLRAQAADGAGGGAAANVLEWSAGDLDDLIAILSAPAVSARVEVLPAVGDVVAGEVHLLAGGVSDALIDGKSVDDALDRLREVKPARFRIEGRLPNPADGDLSHPGPEAGTLEGRALAHLMRYCEDYVISCAIDVWRGSENARVEYKRGEISGVTVGGIDAPERLAEVMQWSSGNYRLVVPPIELPAVAPKRAQVAAAPAPVPAPAPSAQAARQGSATKTIFGMPAAEVMKARAASEAARAAAAEAAAGARRSEASPAQTVIVTPAAKPTTATPAPTRVNPPPVASPAVTPPVTSQRPSATKTIFGVPAADVPGLVAPSNGDSAVPEPVTTAADRKTGARKVSVPSPDVAMAPTAPISAPAPAPTPAAAPATRAAAAPDASAPVRADTTEPVRRPGAAEPATGKQRAKREAPVLAYIGVGITLGVALLGIYHLFGLLAH